MGDASDVLELRLRRQKSVPEPGPFSQDLLSESFRACRTCALGSVARRFRRSSRPVRRRARRSLSRSMKPGISAPFGRVRQPYARVRWDASCGEAGASYDPATRRSLSSTSLELAGASSPFPNRRKPWQARRVTSAWTMSSATVQAAAYSSKVS